MMTKIIIIIYTSIQKFNKSNINNSISSRQNKQEEENNNCQHHYPFEKRMNYTKHSYFNR